jgi:hypothetical protein
MEELRCEVLGREVGRGFRWTAGRFQKQVLDALSLGLTVYESAADVTRSRFGEVPM